MKTNTVYMLIVYSVKSGVIIIIYLATYFVINKIISNRIIKSIFIGLLTSFFVYQFIINFIHPISYVLYLTKLYNPSVAILLTSIVAKPLSIIIGIITVVVLLTQENLIKQLKQDISNLFKNKS